MFHAMDNHMHAFTEREPPESNHAHTHMLTANRSSRWDQGGSNVNLYASQGEQHRHNHTLPQAPPRRPSIQSNSHSLSVSASNVEANTGLSSSSVPPFSGSVPPLSSGSVPPQFNTGSSIPQFHVNGSQYASGSAQPQLQHASAGGLQHTPASSAGQYQSAGSNHSNSNVNHQSHSSANSANMNYLSGNNNNNNNNNLGASFSGNNTGNNKTGSPSRPGTSTAPGAVSGRHTVIRLQRKPRPGQIISPGDLVGLGIGFDRLGSGIFEVSALYREYAHVCVCVLIVMMILKYVSGHCAETSQGLSCLFASYLECVLAEVSRVSSFRNVYMISSSASETLGACDWARTRTHVLVACTHTFLRIHVNVTYTHMPLGIDAHATLSLGWQNSTFEYPLILKLVCLPAAGASADASGLIHVGDKIVAIDSREIRGMAVDDVVQV
jgi:hypothetical protein